MQIGYTFLEQITMNLYAFYLGGKATNANIEVHDVVFAFGNSVEDCYEQCRQKWFGTLDGLHIDAWNLISFVDGFRVNAIRSNLLVVDEQKAKKLYFVNTGMSLPNALSEEHKSAFLIASSEEEAKNRAKLELNFDLPDFHVDNIISMTEMDERFRLVLTSAPSGLESKPTACYIQI